MQRSDLPDEKDTKDHGRVQVRISTKEFCLVGNNTSLLIICAFLVACATLWVLYMLLRG